MVRILHQEGVIVQYRSGMQRMVILSIPIEGTPGQMEMSGPSRGHLIVNILFRAVRIKRPRCGKPSLANFYMSIAVIPNLWVLCHGRLMGNALFLEATIKPSRSGVRPGKSTPMCTLDMPKVQRAVYGVWSGLLIASVLHQVVMKEWF